MKKAKSDVGAELLFLLRQQRCLYHQLKILTERQQQLSGTASPELLLEVVFGRRKLIEKLKELDNKLRPIKANWQKLSGRISPEYKAQAHEMAIQMQELIGKILTVTPPEAAINIPLQKDWKFDEMPADVKAQ